MVGVDVRTSASPSQREPLRGPEGQRGPQGEPGEQGPPGDPAELLEVLAPGEALSVDDEGQPTSLGLVVSRDEYDDLAATVVTETQAAATYLTKEEASANYGALADPAAEVRAMIDWRSMWIADDIPLADGDPVNIWRDGTDGTAQFTQPVRQYQPRLVKSKIGRRSAVSHHASFMRHDLPATLPQPFSAFVVANGNLNAGYRIVSAITSSGAVRHVLGIATSDGHPFASFDQTLKHSAPRTREVARSATIANGLTSTFRYNGVETTGPLGANNLASLVLGAELSSGTPSAFGEVNIAFVGLKAGTFTPQELIDLDAWATDYYGLAVQTEVAQENWSWWTRPRAVHHRGRTYAVATGPNTDNTISVFPGASRTPNKVVVGESGGEIDDHNNGALVIEPGKPPILLYTRHGTETKLKWRRGPLPIEQDPDLTALASASEQTLTAAGGVSYASAHVHNGKIYVLFRDAASDWRWSLTTSTDWGATFSTPARAFAHGYQFYTASQLRGNRLRVATSSHPVNLSPPDQRVYYCEIDLDTGDVELSDGTVLGNLDGTNLPIQIDTLDVVGEPPAGHSTWAYDVSDAPEPEVVWSSFDPANLAATSTYHYSRRSGGVWAQRPIVAAGNKFTESNSEPYLGGVQMPTDSPGGVVYVSREDGGVWFVERRETADQGETWVRTVLDASTARLVRAWPVESRGGTSVHEVIANQITRFVSFNNMESTVRPVP